MTNISIGAGEKVCFYGTNKVNVLLHGDLNSFCLISKTNLNQNIINSIWLKFFLLIKQNKFNKLDVVVVAIYNRGSKTGVEIYYKAVFSSMLGHCHFLLMEKLLLNITF